MEEPADQSSVDGLTNLLDSINAGREGAFADLVDRVYHELRRVTESRMRDQFQQPLDALTLSPTAIVNDAVVVLMKQYCDWKNTEQFFAIATRLIMRLITDYQRHRMAQKRGGGHRGEDLADDPSAAVLDVKPESGRIVEALNRLNESYPRKAEVFTLHLLCNHPLPHVAQMLKIGLRTAERDWSFARAWLRAELR